MSEVKRHSVSGYGRQDICYNDPEGEFVFYSDYKEREKRAEAAEAKLAELEKQDRIIPEGLNRYTAELVLDFSKAIAEKLHQSELKYGWSDGWKESDWQDKCLADFHHHISKGDPRDVAAYCAFMWHHEWPTRPTPAADLADLLPDVEKWRSPEAVRAQMAYCAAILRNIEEAK